MSNAGNHLLKQWLQHAKNSAPNGITATSPVGPLPLSFAQKRLWFLQQWMPDSAGYHLSMAFHVQGTLNAGLMEDSFKDLIRRHAILRTVFAESAGEPVQIVQQSVEFELPCTDVSMLQSAEREERIRSILHDEANRLFDLQRGPLFRAMVIRMDRGESLFALTLHHIITDGWSNGIFLSELLSGYEARVQGTAAVLPELPIQYYDYSRWQAEQFQNGLWKEHITFWNRYLEGAPALIELPLDHPRPAIQSSRGEEYHFSVPGHTLQAFHEMCRLEKVTPVIAFLAVFKLLLHRYSGQADLVIGLPVFNRPRKDTEALIGFFANTLPIRTQIPDERPSFRAWLHAVRESALSAYEHQEFPFEKLVEVLQPERSVSHDPVIQTMLSVGARSATAKHQSGMQADWSTYPYERNTANFDLTLEITEWDNPKFTFVYRADLFEQETIQRLADHFNILLQQCIASPDQQIDRMVMLSSAEQDRILREWNRTDVPYPQRLLHELILEQVLRTPGATAVADVQRVLTYQELNERANQLAHTLKEQGIRSGQLVGICMERSVDMVVALIGVLKAGAAYVPVDPSYPMERIAYMLEDSGVSFLLTEETIENRLLQAIPLDSVNRLSLDRDWPVVALQSKHTFCCGNTVDDLAYMIYTSGSTGKPKGAMNTHKGIVNRLLWMQDEFKLTGEDRVLQKTPFSFDVSVWEFFWPLLAGATLYMAKPEGHKDAAYLIEVIREQRVTTLHFVPSMLQSFLEEPGASSCTSLRRVIVSGEVLSSDLQARFHACFPDTLLYNLYGPTEAAVDVTFWTCEQGTGRRSVPIGRPVANTRIYILDRHLAPVPVGAAGELHIGGVQVGKGYYKREDLTREKFIPDPFEPGQCLYKTGDLAKFTPEGIIEYLGRLDHQVKLRGLRIELGEIEAALLLHPQIREAVVDIYEGSAGDKHLVAYFTASGDVQLKSSEVRTFLASGLPDYMVPGYVIQLDRLPLSPNGKIDRKLLPDPHSIIEHKQRHIVYPSTTLEIKLARIWKELLQLSEVGIEDHFFELGGHSLLVPKVRSLILEQCQVQVSLMDLFHYTTIQALAAFMSHAAVSDASLRAEMSGRAQKQRESLQRMKGRR